MNALIANNNIWWHMVIKIQWIGSFGIETEKHLSNMLLVNRQVIQWITKTEFYTSINITVITEYCLFNKNIKCFDNRNICVTRSKFIIILNENVWYLSYFINLNVYKFHIDLRNLLSTKLSCCWLKRLSLNCHKKWFKISTIYI